MKKILLIITFLLIITTPSFVIKGTINGLYLWSLKVLPGLFITFIISGCILKILPDRSELGVLVVILSGVFCGFPCGAVSAAYSNDELTRKIVGYINISSPAFVINYIYFTCLKNDISLSKFLLAVYLPVILLVLFSVFMHKKAKKCVFSVKHINNSVNLSVWKNISTGDTNFADIFDEALWDAVQNMLKLGGYIIIFSCIIEYMRVICNNPLFLGFFEITNGIHELSKAANLATEYKFIAAVTINAFGGLSTLMQTTGITSGKISIKKYIYQKIILSVTTLIIAVFLVYAL